MSPCIPSSGESSNVASAWDSGKVLSPAMQNRTGIFLIPLPCGGSARLFALFDGQYGGDAKVPGAVVAGDLRRRFCGLVSEGLAAGSDGATAMRNAFSAARDGMGALSARAESPLRLRAVAALVSGDKVVLANLGPSTAVLAHSGTLTSTSPVGSVTSSSDGAEDEPDILELARPSGDGLLVLASAGLFAATTAATVVKTAQSAIDRAAEQGLNSARGAQDAADSLVTESMAQASACESLAIGQPDNVSVIVVDLCTNRREWTLVSAENLLFEVAACR